MLVSHGLAEPRGAVVYQKNQPRRCELVSADARLTSRLTTSNPSSDSGDLRPEPDCCWARSAIDVESRAAMISASSSRCRARNSCCSCTVLHESGMTIAGPRLAVPNLAHTDRLAVLNDASLSTTESFPKGWLDQ